MERAGGADADAGVARLWAQGRDADIDPVELKGKLSACDLGGSTIAQVRLQTSLLPPLLVILAAASAAGFSAL